MSYRSSAITPEIFGINKNALQEVVDALENRIDNLPVPVDYQPQIDAIKSDTSAIDAVKADVAALKSDTSVLDSVKAQIDSLSPELAKKALQTDLVALTGVVSQNKVVSDKNSTDLADLANRVAINRIATDSTATNLANLTGIVSSNKTAADKTASDLVAAASRITSIENNSLTYWNATKAYKVNELVAQNGVIYQCLKASTNVNPTTDTTATSWIIYNPSQSGDIFEFRYPTSTDIYLPGRIFHNISLGRSFPLDYISLGNGNWQALTQVKLASIRIYIKGYASSYTVCNSIRFKDKSGAIYPYNNFIVGKNSGTSMTSYPAEGQVYSGQSSTPAYNTEGWIELIPAAAMDLTKGISGGLANFRGAVASTGITSIVINYNNGGSFSVKCAGPQMNNDAVFLTGQSLDLTLGNPVIANQGIPLDIATLSDVNSTVYGRISGQVLSQVLAPLVARISLLESKIP